MRRGIAHRKDVLVIVSPKIVIPLSLAALTAATFVAASPTAAGNIVRFDAAYAEPAPPSDSPRACWRWSGGNKDWTWACRVGAYKNAYPADPFEPPVALRYDYPDANPVVQGSTLGAALHAAAREPVFVSHAD